MKTNLLIVLLVFTASFAFSQSFDELKKSAGQGDAEAQLKVGATYFMGDGDAIAKDLNLAFYWFKNSAELGYAEAQYLLGIMYYTGQGTSVDKKQAAFWIKKCYENGVAEAKDVWEKYELYKYK